MSPTERARQVHGCIGAFREQRDAVAQHARNLHSGHVMTLALMELSHEACDTGQQALADSPAELSEAILAALFGQWPRPAGRAPGRPTQRPPGVIVRELPWDAWASAAGEGPGLRLQTDAIMTASSAELPQTTRRTPDMQNSNASQDVQVKMLGKTLMELTPSQRAQAVRIASKLLANRAASKVQTKG